MTTKYYRIENKAALDAWDAEEEAKDDLRASVQPLIDQFGGEPMFSSDATSYTFAGLRFCEQPADQELWRKPGPRAGIQEPRRTLKKASPELRQRHKELIELWDSLYPESKRVEKEPLYKAIGTHWGNVLFTGIAMFRLKNSIFVAYGGTLNCDDAVEINGTEYESARNEYKKG